ncbi:hypothetical protein SYNPS1DRAFT_29314 [Syncephalis pseudoplumigaleata]|uniref:DH domain-containing protein n=1 Tax=Syncephalis pseudoplumigaleata TaxID=1712513 RepID=A0A4P9YZB7_9FUNG|nr:hypothetical protein SYNPS1DRAFT_29314 [Syncephalis pseudoplumigaleata]|eukprot:RKP24942.1 hypothetical protein SYNPS1DRAFT_29314 [Syncephalis pseudoplumigaleata]
MHASRRSLYRNQANLYANGQYTTSPDQSEPENPFETAEIIEDDDGISGSGSGALLENPFECSELEYSEEDDDDDAEDDNRPLSTLRLPAGPVLQVQAEALDWSGRPRSRSHVNLSQLDYEQESHALNGKAHSASNSLAPPPPRLPPRRGSFDTSSDNHFVSTVLNYANKRNSVDRARTWSGTVSAHTLATMDEQERKRQEAIFELIITEHVFLRNMVTITEVIT